MKNIDYKLDVYNSVENFCDKMNEKKDSIFIITSSNDGDSFSALLGNIGILEEFISSNKYLQNATEKDIDNHSNMQSFVLNTAFRILSESENKRIKFIEAFKKTLNK